jgi:DNA-binding winged helix-turn-helix (wHTH) protein
LVRGQNVELTSREFDIVLALAEHPGWVFSANQLAGESEEGDYSPESVSVLVSRARHKLASAGAVNAIETVRGIGYRFRQLEPGEESALAEETRHELRECAWRLTEAVMEVEHSGDSEQRRAVCEVLEEARRQIHARLAE